MGSSQLPSGGKNVCHVRSGGRRPSIAFRLDSTNVDFLLGQKNFFPTPYGRGKWVSLRADVPLDWRFVEKLLGTSYRLVALKRMISALDGRSRKPD